MKKLLLLFACLADLTTSYLQEPDNLNYKQGFEIGIGFGEIPYKGSFKPSLTIGYQYYFGNDFSIQAEWTPAWFTPIPTPEYEFGGSAGPGDGGYSSGHRY